MCVLLLLVLVPVLVPVVFAAPPPVSAAAPAKPTATPRFTGAASGAAAATAAAGAHTSVKVEPSPNPARPATAITGPLDPKPQSTVPCPATEHRNLAAAPGQTLTLPCRAPANASVVAVMWTRRDLKSKNVLLVEGGLAVLANQQPWFRSRVTLRDKQMKGGDLSLVLRDARPGDVGAYECRYKERRGLMLITSDSVSTVNLTVPLTDTGSDDAKRQRAATTVALSAVGAAVLLAACVAVAAVTCRRCRC